MPGPWAGTTGSPGPCARERRVVRSPAGPLQDCPWTQRGLSLRSRTPPDSSCHFDFLLPKTWGALPLEPRGGAQGARCGVLKKRKPGSGSVVRGAPGTGRRGRRPSFRAPEGGSATSPTRKRCRSCGRGQAGRAARRRALDTETLVGNSWPVQGGGAVVRAAPSWTLGTDSDSNPREA